MSISILLDDTAKKPRVAITDSNSGESVMIPLEDLQSVVRRMISIAQYSISDDDQVEELNQLQRSFHGRMKARLAADEKALNAGKLISFGDLQRDDTPAIFHRDINTLRFTNRTVNALRSLVKINSVHDLVRTNKVKLVATPNIGKRTISEIDHILWALGLRLGMTDKEIMDYKGSK